MRIIVGITGASGCIIGLRLLEVLSKMDEVETILIVSEWGKKIIEYEAGKRMEEVYGLADTHYENHELDSPLSSGTFKTSGMVIAPCTMSTLAAIANGLAIDLITRAAQVTLKENRRLILVVRETPLKTIDLLNMVKASLSGAVILPPVLTFHHKPKSIEDLVNYVVGKILDLLEIKHELYPEWRGLKPY